MKVSVTEIDVKGTTQREKLQLIEALAASVQDSLPLQRVFWRASEHAIEDDMRVVRQKAANSLRNL